MVKINTKVIAVAVALTVSIVAMCGFAVSKAFAANGGIYMDSSITAVVYDDGHIEFDKAILKANNNDKVVEYRSVTTKLCDGVSQMDDVTWSVFINDKEIYNKQIPGWEGKRFYFDNENIVTINAEGMTSEIAHSLIGKSFASFEFGFIAADAPTENMTITIKSDEYGKVKNGISGEKKTDLSFTYPFLDDVSYKIDEDTGSVSIYHNNDKIITIYNTIDDPENYYHLGWFVGQQYQEPTKYILDGDITLEARHDKFVNLTFNSDTGGQLQLGSNPPSSEPIVYKIPKNFSFTVYDMGTYTYIKCGGATVTNVNNEGFVFDKWVSSIDELAGSPEGITYRIGSEDYTITANHKPVVVAENA